MRFIFFTLVFFILAACPSENNNPPVDRCAGIRCTGTQICNVQTGSCESRDAGKNDGGSPDAGMRDASVDASVMDAGTSDAGTIDSGVIDSGSIDAGQGDGGVPDAGASDGGQVDGGCLVHQQCFGSTPQCDPTSGRCVECYNDSHCFSSTVPICDVRINSCTQCLSIANCSNPTPVCDATAQCTTCNASTECGAGRECSFFGACNALPDSCASPKALNLPNGLGTVSFSVDLRQAVDDENSSCHGAGPELVYQFTTTTIRQLSVTASPLIQSSARPVVYVKGPNCSGPEIACHAPSIGSAGIFVGALPAGTWFVFVESPASATGRVELTVALTNPPTLASNDECTAAIQMPVDGLNQFTSILLGNTELGTNSTSTLSCSASATAQGKDVFYQFNLLTKSDVIVTAKPLAGSTLHPAISLSTMCQSAELACVAQSVVAQSQIVRAGQLSGPYTIQVDGADLTAGDFSLEVQATPVVENENCSSPFLLSGGPTFAAQGDTRFARNDNAQTDATPSCSASAKSTGKDVVYQLNLAQPRDVTISVTPTGVSPTFWPVVSVRQNSCTDGNLPVERACVSQNNSSPARVTLLNQPAGAYYIFVDGSSDTTGTFQLEVNVAPPTPPPSNDTCTSPEVLTFVGNNASAVGSTVQASNDNLPFDVTPTCNSSAKQNGKDVIYAFTLTQLQDVSISVSSVVPWSKAVYVRRANCASALLADEVFCGSALTNLNATLPRLTAGTYFIFVDGSAGEYGAFDIAVTKTNASAQVANDECVGSISIPLISGVGQAQGTTIGASNSNLPIDNAPACGTDFFPRRFGRDVVYSFNLTQAKDVEVEAIPLSGSLLKPAIYLRAPNQCTSFSAGSELACVSSAANTSAKLYVPNLSAGTYFVFVDSDSYDVGSFSLAVRTFAPTLPPSNDTCSAPVALTLGVAVTGSTVGARNDLSLASNPPYSTSCRQYIFNGRDVVYQFTAATSQTVTAVLTPSAQFNPALMLLQGTCSAASCARFADSNGTGVPESFSFSASAGQNYFLVVEAADTSFPNAAGTFSIRVQ
jgi:hypothetical protein